MKMSSDASGVTLLPPPTPRGHPVIAWTIIVLVVAGLLALHIAFQPAAKEEQFDSFEIQARAVVGAASLAPQKSELYTGEVKDLNKGSVGQRLRFVVLAGELSGPSEALARLKELQDLENSNQVEHTAENDATGEILGQLYHDYKADKLSAPAVSETDRQQLRQQLGWFGDLALNPRNGPDPAARRGVGAGAAAGDRFRRRPLCRRVRGRGGRRAACFVRGVVATHAQPLHDRLALRRYLRRNLSRSGLSYISASVGWFALLRRTSLCRRRVFSPKPSA